MVQGLQDLLECEFGIGVHAFPMVYITTFSDGALSATWQGIKCEVIEDRHWWLIRAKVGETLCEVRARRGDATSLDIDWFKFAAPDCFIFDDFMAFDESKFVQEVGADWEWPLTPSQIRGAVRITA